MVHPDFLSSSLALTNFMRLSLMKAAHAPVGGAPCRKSGTMGRERCFSNAFPVMRDGSCSHQRCLPTEQKRWNGLRPVFFGPCTLRRTWGTRPGTRAGLVAQAFIASVATQPRFSIHSRAKLACGKRNCNQDERSRCGNRPR
jgi:hypothetical protein